MYAFEFGFLLSMSLIIAIGAQNLFLIRQGVLNQRPYFTALVCFSCDVLLIVGSVCALSFMLNKMVQLRVPMIWAGIVFLIIYGAFSIKAALNPLMKMPNGEADSSRQEASTTKIVTLALMFSLLNPQALIDSFIIIGGRAGHFHHQDLYYFVLGTLMASLVWFLSLVSIAKKSRHFFKHPIAWRGLNLLSGFLMFYCAFYLWKS